MTRSYRQPLSAHQRLKSATFDMHQALERTYPFCLIPNQLTAESSLDALRLLVHWHESLEIDCHIIKAHRIEDFDLCQQGCPIQSGVETLYESLGRLYVLIGSSLGGKMILKQAMRNNIDLASPLMSYYASLNKLHCYWLPLMKKLEQVISDSPSSFQYIHKAAEAAFRQLLNQAERLASNKALLTKIAS